MYSVEVDSILHVIVAYEVIQYPHQPLVPQVRCITSCQEHTVMIVLPRNKWAKLFLEWTRGLKERQENIIGMNKNQLEGQIMVNRTMQQTTTLTLFTNSITNDILLLF
jgi:hypothetical protein